MAWTRAQVDLLAVMYPDPDITAAQIQAALPHKWESIKKQTRKLGLRRSRRDRPHWSSAEQGLLVELYPTATAERIKAALPGRQWGSIRRQAHNLGVRRAHLVADAIHPLLKTFAGILRKQGVSAVAVLQESGRERHLAREWLRGRSDPRLSHFDGALREAGFHLAIVPLGGNQ